MTAVATFWQEFNEWATSELTPFVTIKSVPHTDYSRRVRQPLYVLRRGLVQLSLDVERMRSFYDLQFREARLALLAIPADDADANLPAQCVPSRHTSAYVRFAAQLCSA